MRRQRTIGRSRSYGIAYGEVPKRAMTRADRQIADHFTGSTLTAITTEPSYPRGPQR